MTSALVTVNGRVRNHPCRPLDDLGSRRATLHGATHRRHSRVPVASTASHAHPKVIGANPHPFGANDGQRVTNCFTYAHNSSRGRYCHSFTIAVGVAASRVSNPWRPDSLKATKWSLMFPKLVVNWSKEFPPPSWA